MVETVALLLRAGADVDRGLVLSDGEMVTPLSYALYKAALDYYVGCDDRHRYITISEMLIDNGADVGGLHKTGVSDDAYGYLHYAAKGLLVSIAKRLLERGVPVDVRTASGMTAAQLIRYGDVREAGRALHDQMLQLLASYQ